MTSNLSLAAGRDYLAIPGPSVMPEAVLRAMHRSAPNIYEGELVEMTHGLILDLTRVARTKHHTAIYVGNGHAAWEAALANTIAPGDTVLILATGRFGHGWGQMACGVGAELEVVDFGSSSPVDLDRFAEALRADDAHRIKAVLAVHVDTSTSIRNDISALRATMDAVSHPALLMADCIASLGCDRFEMDAWGVDVMVTGCQKGLMVPPGVSFVFFNDRAAAARQALDRVSAYWDWAPRVDPEEFYLYFNGTAPTHHLYGLRAALDILHSEGIEQVWARHERLAQAIWAACESWGVGGPLTLNVADPQHRSRAVTCIAIGDPFGATLRDWTEHQIGLTLGLGLGMAAPGEPGGQGVFRLGHMGHVNGHMIMGLLGGLQAGLVALDIPFGDGALDTAARLIAGKS
ncbi:MAG: aminotransferase class V-fold PLP-dependent enzyme [Rhodobacteraceae bacterium]|nr:aminotransferase class V-fold PLP-dependent enzyme [Paracoccaceae bacterium]